MKHHKKKKQPDNRAGTAAEADFETTSDHFLETNPHEMAVPGFDQSQKNWIVFKKVGGTYEVRMDGQSLVCRLSPEMRRLDLDPNADRRILREALKAKRNALHTDPVVVGDAVRITEADDGTGLIQSVLPRRSRLSRRSAVPMPGAHAFEQIIAANVDQVAPVFAAANPAPKWNLLDRYLVSAESLGLKSLIVITKIDLLHDDHELASIMNEYRSIGYQVVLTSAKDGSGLAILETCLEGKITVFVGKSGVGKTSLLNALQPELGLRVNAVSQATGKGRHTTTHQEMFPLDSNTNLHQGAIIDTPGIREFGLWEVDETDLTFYFPEMLPYIGKCRFGLDCRHDEEPGCAIRKAVTAQQISPRRYVNYLHLRKEVAK